MKATVEIRKGTLKDIPEISILWRDCFSENCAYLEHVFSTIYNDATVFVLLENNKIAASLFLFDIKLINQTSEISNKGRYLYGVCTLNKYRKKGYAKKLINHSIKESMNENYQFMLTVPSSAPLFGYYKKLGFTIDVPRGTIPFEISELQEITPTELKINFIEERIKNNYPIRIEYPGELIKYMITSNEILNQNIYKNHKHFGLIYNFDANNKIDYTKAFIGFEL